MTTATVIKESVHLGLAYSSEDFHGGNAGGRVAGEVAESFPSKASRCWTQLESGLGEG